MSIGDRFRILHRDAAPFVDGRVIEISDDAQYAKIKTDSGYETWVHVSKLRSLTGNKVTQAVKAEATGTTFWSRLRE